MIDRLSESKWAPSKSYLYGRSLRNAQRTQKVSFFTRENWSDSFAVRAFFSHFANLFGSAVFLEFYGRCHGYSPAHRLDQQSDQLCNNFSFLPWEPMRVSRYSRISYFVVFASFAMGIKIFSDPLRVKSYGGWLTRRDEEDGFCSARRQF